jgi:cytochrome o ubiquinol oxidase operon protein cyoD
MESQEQANSRILKAYVYGVTLSLLLTLAAYLPVDRGWLSGNALIATIVGLAILQAGVQVVLFLHLGQESKPRWNSLLFLFMMIVVLILVLGSLWIMYHLNYNEMPDMDTLMHHQQGL